MKDFKLTESGDIELFGKDISMVHGEELTNQKVKTVISTNLQEWFLNGEQGIDFSVLMGKNPQIEVIKQAIEDTLKQVDETFKLESFNHTIEGRTLNIDFTATNEKGETVRINNSW